MVIGNCPVCGAVMRIGTDMTNADRIRSMTDEELADWLSIYCCRNKTYDAHCETFGSCEACWLAWLNEEVTD